MAAAAVAAAAEDEHGWVCRACTLLNSKDASECEVCLAKRPNVSIKVYTCDFDEDIDLSPPPGYALEIIRAQFVEDDARTDFTQWLIKILSSHESGGAVRFPSLRRAGLKALEGNFIVEYKLLPLSQEANTLNSQWQCNQCTFAGNPREYLACEVCGAMKMAAPQWDDSDKIAKSPSMDGFPLSNGEVVLSRQLSAADDVSLNPDRAIAVGRGESRNEKHAYMTDDIRHQKSEDLVDRWSDPGNQVLPEYRNAVSMVILKDCWWRHTRLLRFLRVIEARLNRDENLRSKMNDRNHVREICVKLVSKGYCVEESDAQNFRDPILGNQIVRTMERLFDNLQWRKPYYGFALKTVLECDDRDSIVAKISELCDRAPRCLSAQRLGFNLIVGHAIHKLETGENSSTPAEPKHQEPSARIFRSKIEAFYRAHNPSKLQKALGAYDKTYSTRHDKFEAILIRKYPKKYSSFCASWKKHNSLPTPTPTNATSLRCLSEEQKLSAKKNALKFMYAFIEDYLDDHKERAYKSAFEQPARFYYQLAGNHGGRDHVNVHGVNWYLVLMHSALGVQVPFLPRYHDNDLMAVAAFWEGLKDEAWNVFALPENFGLDFEGIKALQQGRNLKDRFLARTVPDCQLPIGLVSRPAAVLGNHAVNPAPGNAGVRNALSTYLERFTYFFTKDFLTKKMFECLNAETKPEHVGFRKYMSELYEHYRTDGFADDEEGAPEDNYADHFYKDEYYAELDVDRTSRFFAWIGVFKSRPGKVKTFKNLLPGIENTFKSDASSASNTVKLNQIQNDLQAAMRNRDSAAVQRLMKERDELRSVESNSRETLNANAEDSSAARRAKMLTEIEAELQLAMRARNSDAIRRLMKERAKLRA